MTSTGANEPGFTVVIGGGGAAAIGISVGIMMALGEAGVDVAQATTAIGTSAGSTVAADIQLGVPLEEIADRVCSDRMDDGILASTKAWRSLPELSRRAIGSGWVLARALNPVQVALPEPPALLRRHFPGSLLVLGESTDWANELYPEHWPDGRVWAVAFDLDGSRRVVIGPDGSTGFPNATLPRALQASCAIPGFYPPVRIDGSRLVDGGIKSASNFDLAARLPQRAVLGISSITFDPADPPSSASRFLRTMPQRTVLREASSLRRRGHEVLLMRPGREALEVAGSSLISGRITRDVVEAAYEGASRRLTEPDLRRRVERFISVAETGNVAA